MKYMFLFACVYFSDSERPGSQEWTKPDGMKNWAAAVWL